MKKNVSEKIVLIVAILLLIISCSNDIMENPEPAGTTQLKNTQLLLNKTLREKLSENIIISLSTSRFKGNNPLNNIDLEKATISEYENTDLKSIVVPVSETMSFITFAKGNELAPEGGAYVRIIKSEDGSQNVSFLTLKLEDFGGYTFKDGIVSNSYGNTLNDDSRSKKAKSWWGSWGECVGTGLNAMTDGSVEGSVMGLLCIAFGPECAIGGALGCAVVATWF